MSGEEEVRSEDRGLMRERFSEDRGVSRSLTYALQGLGFLLSTLI
jgi:hypothetical protein